MKVWTERKMEENICWRVETVRKRGKAQETEGGQRISDSSHQLSRHTGRFLDLRFHIYESHIYANNTRTLSRTRIKFVSLDIKLFLASHSSHQQLSFRDISDIIFHICKKHMNVQLTMGPKSHRTFVKATFQPRWSLPLPSVIADFTFANHTFMHIGKIA